MGAAGAELGGDGQGWGMGGEGSPYAYRSELRTLREENDRLREAVRGCGVQRAGWLRQEEQAKAEIAALKAR